MPPYDPKSKRPKLVPVDDDESAPVDAIIGPGTDERPAPTLTSVPLPAEEPSGAAAVPAGAPADPASHGSSPDDAVEHRPHLSVVPPDAAPRALTAVPSNGGDTGSGRSAKMVLVVAAVVAAIVVTVAVRRRR